MPIKLLPKLLSDVEAEWWGLPTMLPDFPSEDILYVESKWSKKALQRMARENFLDPGGDKELLISKLMYVGAMDSKGEVAEKAALERVGELARLPATAKKKLTERMPRINPHASAIKQDKQLREQMRWLKKHGFKTAREAQEAGY